MAIARSTHRYQTKPAADKEGLRAKIRDLAEEHKAYGYRFITALLRGKGWLVNRKRVHRLWKEEGLQQPRRQPRKRYVGPKGAVKQKATHPNHVWSYDFVEDRTEKGGKIRILTVMDEFTRESLAMNVARSIKATDVIHSTNNPSKYLQFASIR
jgi:transposase InsO family protein